jgi:hypothetical protein
VTQFEAVEEEADTGTGETNFKKPASGRSSIRRQGKASVETTKTRKRLHQSLTNQEDIIMSGERSQIGNSRKNLFENTPSSINPDDNYEFDDAVALQQTPSVFGSGQTKKTRLGSTDEHGNRMSNMPGEERPSLTSVTPYDDKPEDLVEKVEKIVEKSKVEKQKKQK